MNSVICRLGLIPLCVCRRCQTVKMFLCEGECKLPEHILLIRALGKFLEIKIFLSPNFVSTPIYLHMFR